MDAKFVPSADLSRLIELLDEKLAAVNWLFVTLDSCRDDLSRVQEFLTPEMRREHLFFWWEPEGLWLGGAELRKPFVISKIVVPFSAAFIFPASVRRCSKPSFNLTTDREKFTDAELRAASDEVTRLGAVAYAADGVGLQVISSDGAILGSL